MAKMKYLHEFTSYPSELKQAEEEVDEEVEHIAEGNRENGSAE